MMPGMNGVETTKTLRAMGYNKIIVALTANALMGRAEMFLQNGFNNYISKPIDSRELNHVLNEYVWDKNEDVAESVASAAASATKSYVASIGKTVQNIPISERLASAIVRDIGKAITVLENISFNNIDMELYEMTIHGVKSALGNIGETELSRLARELEQAGKSGEIDIIKSEMPRFINQLKLIIEKYKIKTK